MLETAALNQINQKLGTLSLEELIAVRGKADELIEHKSKLEPVPQAAERDDSLNPLLLL